MCKRLFTTALVAVVLSMGFVGVANAAPQAAVAAPSDAQSMLVWFYYNTYISESDCEYAGNYLVEVTRQYRAYFCDFVGGSSWNLWVLE